MEQIINAFPGYEFKYSKEDNKMHNLYRGTDIGFGGYIMSNPGIYGNVALLDVQSMHPNSIVNLNYFGEYTQNFAELLHARILIKHGEYDAAKKLFGGKLNKYLDDPGQAKALSQALKISINSVYGLTSASFETPFRDPRNNNNIVALRGALFMRTLQDEVESRGFRIVAIKTDSIKIADATPEIIKFCMEFANKYGYIFEHEATYERICQINDADYIAKYKNGEWTATGAQFQVPYVFKTLFSKQPIEFADMCETKSVATSLFLDMNEGLAEDEHDYRFIGRVGQFTPIKSGHGGGELLRIARNKGNEKTKFVAVGGSKGYRWLESETVKAENRIDDIDQSYYEEKVNNAINDISQYGDFNWFVSDDPYVPPVYHDGKPIYEDSCPFDEEDEYLPFN